MSWLYLWPLVLMGVVGILLLVGVLMGVNLVLGLMVASLYGLFPKEVLFESVASRLRNKQVEENIQATDEDIINYLHLFKRPRTKEFIYFDIPYTKLHDQEVQLCHEELRRYCQREKTLNYAIQRLSRNR